MTDLPRYSMASIDVTERCNLRCAHCRTWLSASEPPLDHLKRYISELGRLRPRILVLSGGEPLLRADLLELIASARATGAVVQVNTNGLALDAPLVDRLAAAEVTYVQVSLEGPPPLHDAIRGPRTFERALAACRLIASSPMHLIINTTVSRANLDVLEALGDLLFCSEEPLEAYLWGLKRFVPLEPRGGDFATSHALGPDGLERLLEVWRALRARYPGVLIKTDVPQRNLLDRARVREVMARYEIGCAGCSAGVECLTVRPNGDVAPCPTVYVSCGNLGQVGIAEVLRHPVISALRTRNELQGACATCDDRLLCGGCRALAFVTSGDLLAQDPECFTERCAK